MKTIQLSHVSRLMSFVRLKKSVSLFLIGSFCLCSSVLGQTGETLNFDGGDDFVTLPNLLTTGSYTKEAWVNSGFYFPGNDNIISGVSSAFWAPDGFLSAGHSGGYFDVQDPGQMTAGTWYHVAVTYDAGTNAITLYRDGVQVATGTTAALSESALYIGTFSGGSSLWFGNIDEVRIWNVVRSATDIANNRNCILTGDEPGLIAYYDFDQGTAGGSNGAETTLLDRRDASCTPNNGTLSGFALTGATSNFIAPGAGISGACGGTFANINVTGNAVCINDGDPAPSPADDTDFGIGTVDTRTYTIQNTGSATLNIASVVISGINASEFAVTSAPAASVTAGGSTTFDVTFTASSPGTKSATVTINSDDGDEAAYDFAIGILSVLPVELSSFTVNKNGTTAILSWTTSSESNNSGFEILRSQNGSDWATLGFVAGAGTSTIERMYTYTDPNPQKGVNYYRIRQVDLDGNAKLSEIRPVTFAGQLTLVYPVPARNQFTIELADNKLIGTQAVLSDQQGRQVKQITISQMIQQVGVTALPPGMYLLRMEDGTSFKIIKQ